MDYHKQDEYVRKAIHTDDLVTKEQTLRKKILDHQKDIPRLCEFPFLIDVEYLCFELDETKYKVRPGQGDLLFTNGNGEYVAVEIKSSYVCFNGSDRVQTAKTTKLLEQVHFYQEYQKTRLGNGAKVYGCGITEQKVYWMDHDGKFEEFWWSHGPDDLPSLRASPSLSLCEHESFVCKTDHDELPEEYQELHEMFVEESISKIYQHIYCYGDNKIVYLSKCKNKRLTACKEHVAQKEINEIKQRDHNDGFRHGQILMFGEVRPTMISF